MAKKIKQFCVLRKDSQNWHKAFNSIILHRLPCFISLQIEVYSLQAVTALSMTAGSKWFFCDLKIFIQGCNNQSVGNAKFLCPYTHVNML